MRGENRFESQGSRAKHGKEESTELVAISG